MNVRVPLSADFVNGDVSFWYRSAGVPAPGPRLDGDLRADVAIVGGGYTGLWTAYYLKKARPSLDVVVLEKEFTGFGASGRNGGWLTGDLAGSHERYAKTHGVAAAKRLQREMYASVDEVIAVCAEEGIDADIVKGGVLNVARSTSQAARLRESVGAARAWGIEEDDLRLVDPSGHLRVAGAVTGTWSPHCARIQPAKLAQGLAEVVRGLGVRIFERTEVTEILPHRAVTAHGTVEAGHVIRATEGFTSQLKGLRRQWLPMNSSMIVTAPLPASFWDEVGWQGAELLGDLAHYYMYAQRTADDRIAFGGRGRPYLYGSRVDARGHTHEWTVEALWQLLVDFFPAAASSRVDHAWSGCSGCRATGAPRSTSIRTPAWAGRAGTPATASPRRTWPAVRCATWCWARRPS